MIYAFRPSRTDFRLSPYTGMTRESWIEAGKHLLTGVFSNIHSFDDPVVLPRSETEITYPHAESPKGIYEAECRAEIFEGLTRTLFIAAPLMKNDPSLTISGFCLADYYRSQILRSCTPGDPVFVGTYESLQDMTDHADPFRAFQQTVETCALVIGLWISRDVIWNTYTKEEKDLIASFLTGYAHAPTVPQNWRFFNLLDLAFLHMNGYPIDHEIMMDHANELLAYCAGDGWYRDGHCFDYYSCWAFQVYGPIWNAWYGYENAPEIASLFEKHSNVLMKTYPDFFDEDGHTNMWGRSNIYRFAAASALDANFYLKNPSVKPGLARRICSGSLLQFMGREDFYDKNGIPSMGFYGPFSPLVQPYSCAESVYWMGKAFLCLDLPKDHPFWTDTEENGSWETFKPGEVKSTVLDGPALCFTDHKDNGSVILRTGKIVKNCGDRHAMWNYGKLSYHSRYPWEAGPAEQAGEYSVESQQYVLTDETDGTSERCNVTFWSGERDGVLYRRQYFNYTLDRECMWMQAVSLADFPVPLGLMRADRIRLYRRPVTLTLGAFGFPDNGTKIIRKSDGKAEAVILKGFDSQGQEKQLAMTIYDGWDQLKIRKSRGSNPDSQNSLIVYGETRRNKQYGGAEPYILISQILTKESQLDFIDEELFPLENVSYSDLLRAGGFGPVFLTFKNGRKVCVDFSRMEGSISV